jgi:hypothetical protein
VYTATGSDHWGGAGIHDSMARLHGGSRVGIEGFHGTGWGGTLEETIDWLSTGWGGTLEETIDWLSPWIIAGANL